MPKAKDKATLKQGIAAASKIQPLPAIDLKLDKIAGSATPENIKRIADLARQALDLEAAMLVKATELKSLKARYDGIVTESLPGAMFTAGVKTLGLDTGEQLETNDVVFASISEENRAEAHKWLRANKFGGLIKAIVSVAFGKGEEAKATKLYKELLKKKFAVEKGESVHSSTLKAFCKERLAEGKELPPSIHVHVVPTTSIKLKERK